MEAVRFKKIAHIESDFHTKFGIPRQSGLVEELTARVVFEPEYRMEEAFRGIEEFSHLWLIWHFSENEGKSWSPTVRPPRLGGNRRVGVFASRSPFRPNGIGLSCVRLLGVEKEEQRGMVLCVAGADLMNGTAILDIKPYIPFTDCRRDAGGGFSEENEEYQLQVVMGDKALADFPEEKRRALEGILAEDPRPAYHRDSGRRYGMELAGYEIQFRVKGHILEVERAEKIEYSKEGI